MTVGVNPPRVRTGALAVAMMPPWAAYLVALTGWPDDRWVDPAWLELGMNVEYISAVLFPVLAALAIDRRPPRAARVLLFLASAAAVTAFIVRGLGRDAATLFWLAGIVTYAGWIWSRPDEVRAETLAARILLTVGCLIPIVFAVIVLAAMTNADPTLLLGFVYFLTLHALEASGTQARFFRWYAGLRRRSP